MKINFNDLNTGKTFFLSSCQYEEEEFIKIFDDLAKSLVYDRIEEFVPSFRVWIKL